MKPLLVPLTPSLIATRAIARYLSARDRLYRIDVLIPGPLP